MKHHGTLPFEFTGGSCGTFNSFNPFQQPGQDLYLCFGSYKNSYESDDDDYNGYDFEDGCYYTDVTHFSHYWDYMFQDRKKWKIVESGYPHRNTMGLGNYRGLPFVTGCDSYSWCYTKTEIIEAYHEEWTDYSIRWNYDYPDYPFVPDSGLVHENLAHKQSVLLHGPLVYRSYNIEHI